MSGEVGARPQALALLARSGRALDGELEAAIDRAGAALEDFLTSRPDARVAVDAHLPAPPGPWPGGGSP